MKILLTGATGFVGSRLVSRLLSDTDHELVLLVRPGRERELPADPRILVAEGDVTDSQSVARALDCCECVIHAAARVNTWARDRRDFDRVNITGTLDLLRLAGKAGVRKIIYLSTFLALGSSSGTPLDEHGPHERDTHFNDYERTKYAANLAARELAARGLPLITLYPAVVYGPGPLTAGNMIVNLLVDYITGRLPARIGHGRQRWNFVYVDDLVGGILLALEKAAPGSRYILGGENISMNGFFDTVEAVTGKRRPRLAIPFGAARVLGALEEIVAELSGRMPQTTRGVIDLFRKDWVFDSSLATRELGYSARPLKAGLDLTVDWIRREVLNHSAPREVG